MDTPKVNCSKCGALIDLVQWQGRNGVTHVRAWCKQHRGGWHKFGSGGVNLPKENFKALYEMLPAQLPLMAGVSNDTCTYQGCEENFVELHHIMPRFIKDDFEYWPLVFLCKKHHAEWHSFVTPGMNKRR